MKSRKTPPFMVFLVVGIILALGYTGVRLTTPEPSRPMAPEPDPAPAHVRRLTNEAKQRVVRLFGSTAPHRQSILAAEIAGKVIWRSPTLESGGKVQAGEVILKLDHRSLALGLRAAEAQLEMAEADVEACKTEISRADSAWSRAHEMESLAEAEWKRASALAAKGDTSLSLRDQAQQKQLNATMARENAHFARQTAQAALDTAQGAAKLAAAQWGQAQVALEKTELHAPFEGELSQPRVEVGDWLNPGTPVSLLVDRSRLKVEALLPNQDGFSGEHLPQVWLRFNAFKTEEGNPLKLKAEILGLDPVANEKSRARPLVLGVDNEDLRLPVKAFAYIVLKGDWEKAIWIRPAEFLPTDDGAVAFVIENGLASRRALRLGRALIGDDSKTWYPVLKGLGAGESLAISNLESLQHGAEVLVLDALPEAETAQPAQKD